MPSSKKLNRILMGELESGKPFERALSSGSTQIGQMTRKRVKDLLGKLSSTGLGRTGIGGAAVNQAFQAGGQAIGGLTAGVAGKEAGFRSDIINKLLGLYKFDKEMESQETDFGDFLGAGAGMLAGSLLGPLGAAGGSYLGNLLTGKSSKGGGGNLFMPSIEKLKA